jgi:hypothetical protein
LSSPPTISHDDEDQQSDSTVAEKEKFESVETVVKIEVVEEKPIPVQVFYQNRNILDMGENVRPSNQIVRYTVLPENNLTCFFQNRAQYWRLNNSSNMERVDALEKCSCCDFTYPAFPQFNQGHKITSNKNVITDSLMTFLKNNIVDYSMPNSSTMSAANVKNNMNIGAGGGVGNNNSINNGINSMNMGNNSRFTGAPYNAYQMMQQQQQQYQNNNNTGFFNAMNGYNQQVHSFANNVGGAYNNNNNNNNNSNNGTTLALLNLMNNASRNVTAFQAMNNNSRYYNNMNNNGFGLYKQF